LNKKNEEKVAHAGLIFKGMSHFTTLILVLMTNISLLKGLFFETMKTVDSNPEKKSGAISVSYII